MKLRLVTGRSLTLTTLPLLIALCILFVPGVLSAADTDEVATKLAKAKELHRAALKSLGTSLVSAMDRRVKAVAAEGNLQKAKGAVAEKEAWENEARLPTSPAFSSDVQDYLKARRAASNQLVMSYRDACAAYTKQLKLKEATSIEEEKDAFIEKEKSVLTAQNAKQAEPQTNPDDKTAKKQSAPKVEDAGDEYIAEFVGRLRESIAEVAAEDTSAKRDKAYRDLLTRLDTELQTKKITLKFSVKNIAEAYDGQYTVYLNAPEQIQGERGIRHLGGLQVKMSEQQAASISAGDTFSISGTGRIASGGFGHMRAQNVECVVTVVNDNGADQSIYLQNYGLRITKNGSNGKEVLFDLKGQAAKKGGHLPKKKSDQVR